MNNLEQFSDEQKSVRHYETQSFHGRKIEDTIFDLEEKLRSKQEEIEEIKSSKFKMIIGANKLERLQTESRRLEEVIKKERESLVKETIH